MFTVETLEFTADARIPLHNGEAQGMSHTGKHVGKSPSCRSITVAAAALCGFLAAAMFGFFVVAPGHAADPKAAAKFSYGIGPMMRPSLASPNFNKLRQIAKPAQADLKSRVRVDPAPSMSAIAEVEKMEVREPSIESAWLKEFLSSAVRSFALLTGLGSALALYWLQRRQSRSSISGSRLGTVSMMSASESSGEVALQARSRTSVPRMMAQLDEEETNVFQKLSEAVESKPELSRRVALAGGLAGLLGGVSPALAAQGATPWATKVFLDAVESGQVERVIFAQDGRKILCIDSDGNRHESFILPSETEDLTQQLQKKGIEFTVSNINESGNGPDLGAVGGPLLTLGLPVLILGFLAYRARNQDGQSGGGMGGMGGMGGQQGGMNPFNIGKSKSKIQMEPQTGVTFADVAGQDGAKLELTEVVDFLKNPSKYSALGAKIPKGVVMEGPPGTGKTLLARAIAGEAGVPFVSASGSEFVEMFVGVGASRVRDLFGEAKKNAPCIVFIDEIDAIGGARGDGGMSGGNDEREQTLNQILTEMDGFEGNTGVIVVAATNRADTLDSALVRPGRFDRRVPVDLPDVAGRKDILKVHIRGKPLKADVDLAIVAKRTTGFSGAALANLMNEAAIVAARNGLTEIGYEQIDYAIDRATVGMQKATGMSFPARQRLVAYHEAGHAICGLLSPEYDQVTKVTIIPRTNGAGGFTLFTPTDERMESGMYSKKYLCSQLVVALGGRVAEELVYGREEVTTGASNDLQQVRNIARRMVTQWGFANENMGEAPVAWEMPEGNPLTMPRTASAQTEKMIDDEVKKLVSEAFDSCKKMLSANRDFLDEMTERLIEEETLDFNDLAEMRSKFVSIRGSAIPLEASSPVPVAGTQ